MEAKSWATRPSELLGLAADSLEAWCFDSAVGSFGRALENALETAGNKAKNQRQAQQAQLKVINKWLPEAGGPKYRDPAAR